MISTGKATNLESVNVGEKMEKLIHARSYPMMGIEHTRDAVETETVKLVFFHPETEVA